MKAYRFLAEADAEFREQIRYYDEQVPDLSDDEAMLANPRRPWGFGKTKSCPTSLPHGGDHD